MVVHGIVWPRTYPEEIILPMTCEINPRGPANIGLPKRFFSVAHPDKPMRHSVMELVAGKLAPNKSSRWKKCSIYGVARKGLPPRVVAWCKSKQI